MSCNAYELLRSTEDSFNEQMSSLQKASFCRACRTIFSHGLSGLNPLNPWLITRLVGLSGPPVEWREVAVIAAAVIVPVESERVQMAGGRFGESEPAAGGVHRIVDV